MTARAHTAWFRCRNCQATLGEVVGARLVVVVRGMTVTFPLVADACFTCRKCGEPNTLASVLQSGARQTQGRRVQSA